MKYWTSHQPMPDHIEKALRDQPRLDLKPEWVAYQFEPIFPIIPALVAQIDTNDLLIFRVSRNLFNHNLKATLIHQPNSIAPLPRIKEEYYYLQRINDNFKSHYRVSFDDYAQNHTSWVEHEYLTEDTQGNHRPMAYTPFTVHFSNEETYSGHLNYKGFSRHDNIPKGPVQVVYAKTLDDSKLKNSESLLQHLNHERQELKNVLDRIIERHKEQVSKQKQALRNEGLIGQEWMLTRSFLAGAFSNIEQQVSLVVHTWVDIHNIENTTGHDILKSIEHGSLQPLYDQLSLYCYRFTDGLRIKEATVKKLVTLCSDKSTRMMLLDFVKQYFQTTSDQEIAHMSGSISVQLLLIVLGGSEGAAAEGTITETFVDEELDAACSRSERVADAIEHFHAWAERMSHTEHRIRTVRRDKVDSLSHQVYLRDVHEDLKKVEYVYRGISRQVFNHYMKAEKITDKIGGNSVYFAIDNDNIMEDATPMRYKTLTQIKDAPEIILKIPLNEIMDIDIPHPNWNKETYGYEYKIKHEQCYGIGGLYQLFGKTSTFSKDWVIYGEIH